MRNRKKSIFAMIICIVILLMALPAQGFAAGKIDTDASNKLEIYYHYDEIEIPETVFSLYRIAELDEYANMTLTEAFQKYPIDLESMTEESWNDLALTLQGYAQADGLKPDFTGKTDAEGYLSFEELPVGLYLVTGENNLFDHYIYSALPAIVRLPEMDYDNNTWSYEQFISPKVSRERKIEHISLKAMKVWDEEGDKSKRPKEISITLLRDGEKFETVQLNAENDWRYVWEDLEASGEDGVNYNWTMAETAVEGYTVKITREGAAFIIRNTYIAPNPPEKKLPQTGMLWWPIPVLILAGIILLVVGVARRKRS